MSNDIYNGVVWKKHDAYKPQSEWNGKRFYRVIGGKWVMQDVLVTTYEKSELQPYSENCLTFSSAEAFTIENNIGKSWDGTLYYSTDATTWSEWDGTTPITSAEHDGEQRIYMRGSGNSVITPTTPNKQTLIMSGGSIRCNGNIENLLDYESVCAGEHPKMGAYCFSCMFYKCTNLITAPELPATTLESGCYHCMFYGCTNLTTAPELPATTLAENCYSVMFWTCTSLINAPELPATTLAEKCYMQMFYGCSGLTTIPELPATALERYCYYDMFNGCSCIKISSEQSEEYPNEYRIPTNGEGTTAYYPLNQMFTKTGGTFTGTPEINKTYYTSNTVV